MGSEYGFITDDTWYWEHSENDIGTEVGGLTIRGTVRDFTPDMKETMLAIVEDRDDNSGLSEPENAQALLELMEINSGLADEILTADAALSQERGIVRSLEGFDAARIEELWDKVEELDSFYGGRIEDLNSIAASAYECICYVRDLFRTGDPLAAINRLTSFYTTVDGLAENLGNRQLEAARNYVLEGATGDIGGRLDTMIADLRDQGYNTEQIAATLWRVENGQDLSALFLLSEGEYESLFCIPDYRLSDGTLMTLAVHATVLLEKDPTCGTLQQYINALVDVDGPFPQDILRRNNRDGYLERIYTSTQQLVYADSLAIGYALATGQKVWRDEHIQLLSLAGLWGTVYTTRTDKDVHGMWVGHPSSVSLSGLRYSTSQGFAYSLTFHTSGAGGVVVANYKTIEVTGTYHLTPGGMEDAETNEAIQRLNAEAARQWMANLDGAASVLSSVHPYSKAAYIMLRMGIASANNDGLGALNQGNKLAEHLDSDKNAQAMTFALGMYISLAQNSDASTERQAQIAQLEKDLLNRWAGMGYVANYTGAGIDTHVVFHEPWNFYTIASLVTWANSEEGIRCFYTDENNPVAVKMRTAVGRVEEDWIGTDGTFDDLEIEQRFVLRGIDGLKGEETVEDLDWERINKFLGQIQTYGKNNLAIDKDILEDLSGYYRNGEDGK